MGREFLSAGKNEFNTQTQINGGLGMPRQSFYIFYRMFKKGEASGQIAVLITLMVAVAFLFVAVMLNLNSISRNKLMVTIAAQTGAISMASAVGSWSYYLKMDNLGGHDHVCKLQDTIGKVIAAIIAIALTLMGQPHLAVLLIISVILTAASLIIDQTVIQPGEIEAWNKEMKKLTEQQQFPEIAIRSAMLMGVTNDRRIQDTGDTDMDGTATDFISEFAEQFRQRLARKTESQRRAASEFLVCGSLLNCSAVNESENSLADIMAYISGYKPPYAEQQCGYSNIVYATIGNRQLCFPMPQNCPAGACPPAIGCFVDPACPLCTTTNEFSFLKYLGEDTGGTTCSGTLTRLFYDIEAMSGYGEDYNIKFWSQGTNPGAGFVNPGQCWVVDDVDGDPSNGLQPIPNDCFDAFKIDLMSFHRWGYGGWTEQEFPLGSGQFIYKYTPGIATTPFRSLAASFDTWFKTQLYNPLSFETWADVMGPGDKWDTWISQWLDRVWPGSLGDIAIRMQSESQDYIGKRLYYRDTVEIIVNVLEQNYNDLQNAIIRVATCAQPPNFDPCDPADQMLIITLTPIVNGLQLAVYSSIHNNLPRGWEPTNAAWLATNPWAAPFYNNPFIPGFNYIPDARSAIQKAVNDLIGKYGFFGGPYGAPPLQDELRWARERQRDLDAITPRIVGSTSTSARTVLNHFLSKIDSFEQNVLAVHDNVYNNPSPPTEPDNRATYSWHDKQGYCHIVRVEVAVPCRYPYTREYEDGTWPVEYKCHDISPNAGAGWVGVRVTRYDEDQRNPMRFAGGTDLWRFLFHNPSVGPYVGPDPCDRNHATYGANMTEALRRGVSSTSCANYSTVHESIRLRACPNEGGGINDLNFTPGSCHGPTE